MADCLEAIASKLGQPSGPAALKRWLEALTARDGIRSAAHAPNPSDAPPPPSGTIEVLTGDLELEVVTVEDQLYVRRPARRAADRGGTSDAQSGPGSRHARGLRCANADCARAVGETGGHEPSRAPAGCRPRRACR